MAHPEPSPLGLLPVRGHMGVLWCIVDLDVLAAYGGDRWYYAEAGEPRPFKVPSAVVDPRGGQQRLARLLTKASPGQWVKHLNHDVLDCRRSNLVLVDTAKASRPDPVDEAEKFRASMGEATKRATARLAELTTGFHQENTVPDGLPRALSAILNQDTQVGAAHQTKKETPSHA